MAVPGCGYYSTRRSGMPALGPARAPRRGLVCPLARVRPTQHERAAVPPRHLVRTHSAATNAVRVGGSAAVTSDQRRRGPLERSLSRPVTPLNCRVHLPGAGHERSYKYRRRRPS